MGKQKIGHVGQQNGGGLACPRCGGAQFKAKRSGAGKVMAGALAPKSRVKCITCGAEFKRGGTAPATGQFAPTPQAPPPTNPPGWYPDPYGQAQTRYWDGQTWTSGTA